MHFIVFFLIHALRGIHVSIDQQILDSPISSLIWCGSKLVNVEEEVYE